MHDLNIMPIGIHDFATIRRNGYKYVDKTMFVQSIEHSSNHAFVIRPHGFGRTLMISMLEAYYDVNRKYEWDELFGDLAIASCPTEGRSSYFVVHLDFGGISGNLSTLRKEVYAIYKSAAKDFINRYKDFFPADIYDNLESVFSQSPVSYLNYIVSQCHEQNHKLYVFVDNYDCVVGCVIRQGGKINPSNEDEMKGLHAYFSFFDVIKNTSAGRVDKLLAMGAVPITIETVLNGFDLGSFYASESIFNGMMGFDESEVRSLLNDVHFDAPIDDLVVELRRCAGGYCFSPECLSTPRLFAPHKVFSFIKAYNEYGYNYPASVLGCDVCPLLSIRDVEYDSKTFALKEPFGVDDIVVGIENFVPVDNIVDSRYFISLLYYYGLLTIVGHKWGTPVISVPNETARAQIKEFLNS